MYKFIKQYVETMKAANIYPMISLFIFFLFFIVLLFFVKKMRRESVDELSNIPLDNDAPFTNQL